MSKSLSEREVALAMDRVPLHASRGGHLAYTKLKFNRAPQWSEARPFADSLSLIRENTGGRQVTQVSLASGITAWNKLNKVGYTAEQCEAAAYKLRAMLSQLRCTSEET
jgi:hypothetical protein